MDARLQRRVQRYGWDRAAETYESCWQEQLAPAHRRLLDMADLRTGQVVLDTACGTGMVSLPAARAVGPTGELVGTDISRVMVETASERALRAGALNARFVRMGAEDLDLEDESFDVALCALGLMYVPDPVRALEESHRVLRSGGRCVAAVWGDRRNCGWAGIFPVVDERVSTEVCPLFFRLGTGDLLARSFERAGFVDIETDRISARLRYASEDGALGAAFVGGPVAMAYSRFDEATKEEAHGAYLDTIADYRTRSGYDIPGEFVVVSGVKGT